MPKGTKQGVAQKELPIERKAGRVLFIGIPGTELDRRMRSGIL